VLRYYHLLDPSATGPPVASCPDAFFNRLHSQLSSTPAGRLLYPQQAICNLLKTATRKDTTVQNLKLSYYTSLHIYYIENVSNTSSYVTTSYQCDEPLLKELNVGVILDRHEPKLNSPDNFKAVTNKTFPNYTIEQIMPHF
jgi:hypothetical protein